MALNNFQIDYILKNNHITKKYFIGTFPACQFPDVRKRKYGFITNTDTHDKQGTHWNAWWVEGDTIIFFDSYGRKPNSFNHYYIDFISKFRNVKYCSEVLQNTAFACGYFCIHFIYDYSIGLNLNHIIDYASDDNVIDFVDSII